jgi:type I restriction enzyme R subunit
MGDDNLKELAQRMLPGDVQNLLKAVNARIDNVNLKNAFSHEQEVSGMINEALASIDFKFRKRGENEMEIGSDIKDKMKQARINLSNEMQECIDPEDEEYISLTKIIQEHFAKKKFEVGSMAEAKEEIGFMDQCMARIRKINRENANLQAKYRGDSKYVRAHKKIRRHEQKFGETMLSEKEIRQCEALNRIKDAIDVLISNRREIIFNEADFNAQVIGAVAKCLHEIDIRAKRDDRTYVAGILAGEYLREFNVIR